MMQLDRMGRRRGVKAGLLLGASALVLAAVDGRGANAQSVAALMAATHQTIAAATMPAPVRQTTSTNSTASGMAAAAARATQYQNQINSTLSMAQQAQAAAQAAAKALNQNQAAGIVDGLGVGGLQPAVTQITSAASDPTGKSTWQGAALPTVGSSPNSVTVVQTDPRAVLSWNTFNVGQNTTLTFQQQLNGVDQGNWVVVNRVVGASTAPATILGAIKAPGTVLVLNQNGILFGPTSQVNVGSLVASTLELGHALENGGATGTTLQTRNVEFLNDGLLGFAELNQQTVGADVSAFSEMATVATNGSTTYAAPSGQVQVQAGASLTSANGGFLMLIGPSVTNAGSLTSNGGEVALQSGGIVTLTASTGDANSVDPDVRGLVLTGAFGPQDVSDSVVNASTGIIQAPRGYVSLGAAPSPPKLQSSTGVTDAGVIMSTTSVSENGYVDISASNISIAANAVIAIGPDSDPTLIPQDQTSLSSFKPSRIRIGGNPGPATTPALIDVGANSLIYAPGGNISIGADPGQPIASNAPAPMSDVTIESGATIDAAGLTDVLIPASRNTIKIDPVKGNELANAPAFRNGFLNGATVYLDPRLSGVTADGVAWVGSPLISAGAYAQQVGISVSELMVAGGNVTLGVQPAQPGAILQGAATGSGKQAIAPQVVVASGATIDISGGWKTFESGFTQESYLVTPAGTVVPISQADPDATYVGLYTGFTTSQPRWGVSQSFSDPVLTGRKLAGQYTEGQDGGSLTLSGSVVSLDGQVFASAFPGAEQITGATPGTKASSVFDDDRLLQAAPSQLPSGGYIDVQALGLANVTGGGDISIEGAGSYKPGPATTISLNADALSAMGLGQLTVQTSGAITVSADAAVTLAPGGHFEALAGRAITIDGSITAPSGSIDLTTADIASGSVFDPLPKVLPAGSFDIDVNGRLSVAGRWVNDFTAPTGQTQGPAYLNGGEITLDAAPRVTAVDDTPATPNPSASPCAAASAGCVATDISGSILIDPQALLDATGGGYVTPSGALRLTAKGGNVSLFDDTTYFQVASVPALTGTAVAGGIPGFRVSGMAYDNSTGSSYIPVNPAAITSRVSIPDGTILDQGFGGGGTFTLTTPQFSFGASPTTAGEAGTTLPLDFFSKAGFAAYNITTYQTALIPNVFYQSAPGATPTTYGGYNAVLQTDVATVGDGQTLALTQSYFSPLLNPGQITALQALATGANLASATGSNGAPIVTATIPTDAWDQKPVSLTLGGLTELHVTPLGQVTGAAGAALTTGQLFNEGTIRLPGGTITQSLVLPSIYGDASAPVGVSDLSQVFSVRANGQIVESDASLLSSNKTNAEVAAGVPIYLLGDLNAGEGVRLAPGSVTDLSGEAIVDPRAKTPSNTFSAGFTDGAVVAGGSLISTDVFSNTKSLFQPTYGVAAYLNLAGNGATPTAAGLAESLTAAPGSTINLSGAEATFDRPTASSSFVAGIPSIGFAPTPVWSNGGNLTLDSGGTVTGANILAQGGAPLALGGVLTVLDPVLYQVDPSSPAANEISASMITAAGFSTLVAEAGLTSSGNVTLQLTRSLFVESAPRYQSTGSAQGDADAQSPVLGAGGRLEIDAPYIALDGAFQSVSDAQMTNASDPHPNGRYGFILKADAIDITGAVVFDDTISSPTLSATGDLRLIGVAPSTVGLSGPPPATLVGELVTTARSFTINAAQVYPTTGSDFFITDHLSTGKIAFTSPGGAPPPAPYSAGGSLTVQASTIDQGGVLRVPLGSLTLGGNTALQTDFSYLPAGQKVVAATDLAPATKTLTLDAGSITSVSADGLDIPYGTTTDQKEWYFTPTNASQLTGPPAGVLHLAGQSITATSGATVDLTGGGDIYAYEFVPGTGGTRDVLDQFNSDQFSSTNGYQYPDGRQIYAIVPGLSAAQVAALDPIYSSDYSALYGPSQAGLRVYLNAAPGLAAGWYTLLPAKYALLPGGMRVVQDTTAPTPPQGGSGAVLSDGTIVASGYFGVAGTNAQSSTLDVFDVQSQAVFRTESNIALTTGNATFAADAAHNGVAVPQLPIDAGRLILDPQTALALGATFLTTPAAGGRGAEVDVTGAALVIDPASSAPPVSGAVVLTDASLDSLNASSLLLGGIRTDNADGTTSLAISSRTITVSSGVSLLAPEIVMATDGVGANLTIQDGASIVASGAVSNEPTGNYVIEGLVGSTRVMEGQGAVLRVSNGPERLVVRNDVDTTAAAGGLVLGAATLQGASVELNSLGGLTISNTAAIRTNALAVTANTISFGANGSGLVVTPALQALFGQAGALTLQSPNAIAFAPGTYTFGQVNLDTPGLVDGAGGGVTLIAGSLKLTNSTGAATLCGQTGALACGGGDLSIDATQIAFGSGPMATAGFGGSVTLSAAQGMFIDGAATFDAGSATLQLNTPFLGDRGNGMPGAVQPSLTLTSTVTTGGTSSEGAIVLASATPASSFTAPQGAPGATLKIDGASVTIQGTELRATAGLLDIESASGISVSGGAVLATPAYAQVFGDSADPTLVSAPGGLLRLGAASGDVSISDDSQLAIGGAQGQAGSLQLSAPNGQVYAYHGSNSNVVALASVLSTGAPGSTPLSGASLTLQTGGAFDLSAFLAGAGQYFTGNVGIESGQGDLVLAQGQTLKATSVSLTADGGQISDSGTIDTSGVNGGDVSLYGMGGVHLFASAVINAQGSGYGLTDTRQAHGGDVVLGLGSSGAITVDAGAVIDVTATQTAANPGDRLVQLDRTDGSYYSLVAADVGGTVTFRAPVISSAGGETVAVSVQGALNGASSVTLEGVQSFDLQALANNPAYVGVKTYTGAAALAQGCPSVAACAVLDLGAFGGVNALGYDTDASGNPIYANGKIINGPVVDFVQNFNVAADYGALNGLAALPNFHARPGIELGFAGDIVLASNWNLGAGVVNVADAVKAGLMTPINSLPGQYSVTPGDEGQILALASTVATYRVGGTFSGEPGDLAIRAGGNLILNGSITDGFFQFRDQTNPQYLGALTGGAQFQPYLNTTCTGGASACNRVVDYTGPATTGNSVVITFPAANKLTASETAVSGAPVLPFSAIANSPSAEGSLAGGSGDSLGSAELFPLLPGDKAVGSWSYQLVGGAGAAGNVVRPSANPLTTDAASNGGVTVQGYHVYSYGGDSYTSTLQLNDSDGSFATIQDWLTDLDSRFTKLDANSSTTLNLSRAPLGVRQQIADQFAATYSSSQYTLASNGNITTTLTNAVNVLSSVLSSFSTSSGGAQSLASYYAASIPSIPPTFATAPTLVRTGTGSIALAAAGAIDLSNDHVLAGYSGPTTLNSQGQLTPALDGIGQLGGAAVYTAGEIANLGSQSAPVIDKATDFSTGVTFNVTLNDAAAQADNFASALGVYLYGFGGDNPRTGYAGILIANPVYASGGGDVSLNAGGDVLGQRDTFQEDRLGAVGASPDRETQLSFSWIGTGNQPWRTGSVGSTTSAQINPQLFGEGIGTLGGGDISVRAGGNISDISIVSTDSLSTGCAAASCGNGGTGSTLVTLGGGSVSVAAAGNLLGGRLDVASGAATVKVQGDLASAGQLNEAGNVVDNTLRVRLSDATVEIDAGGSATLQGVAALGVGPSNPDSTGFYSPASGLSILAGGGVTLFNAGYDLTAASGVTTQPDIAAVYPGSFAAISLTGGLSLSNSPAEHFTAGATATETVLYPTPTGTLTLMAAGDISQAVIAQEDADPTILPGAFSTFSAINDAGLPFTFPVVLSDTTDVMLREMHAATPTHTGDATPNRIVAGNDIDGLILATAKQTRIAAGQDIVNMVFLGQNVSSSDITRITAGRDITATTTLATPQTGVTAHGAQKFGSPLPTVQGDTFVLGGPGALFLEAGRDAGPFLNSAVANGFELNPAGNPPYVRTGVLTFGGGILTVGNLWNPSLPAQGADIVTEFGVGKGQNFAGLVSTYLDPSNFGSQPDYLFLQTTDAAGNTTADRTQEVYSLSLVDWMKSIASSVISSYDTGAGVTTPPANAPAFIQFMQSLQTGGTATTAQALQYLPQLSSQTMPLIPWMQLHESSALMSKFGALDVTYQQALAAFEALPQLTQREFLIKDVYFNELIQTSVPSSPSYLKYSRGYQAVNTLFPAADGYTANSLSGGPAGASSQVQTGNLDLRLATIQTEQGGDISILGPGGRVLAGSTVSTSVQASRRAYEGGALYSGDTLGAPITSTITAIPSGYEGVLTLDGGSIRSFTDGDFLLNQSRAFTVGGGDVAIWSSNADVNAGQGPRTTADVPPLVVRIDADGYGTVNQTGAVSGAGIGAFSVDSSGLAPSVFLIAPRGVVDAGDAGVRSAGNVFIAAFQVANANNIQAGGTISGVQGPASVNVAAQTSGDAASSAAAAAAQAASSSGGDQNQRPVIFVDVLGFLGDEASAAPSDDDRRRGARN